MPVPSRFRTLGARPRGGGRTRQMQLGFNTNIRYRGVQFHVQTEDSGAARPHVITHLYHGGTILASEKSGYSELLEERDLEARVRALMGEQHQEMVRRLQSGELDGVLEERLPGQFAGGTVGPDESGQTGRDTQPSSLSHTPPPPRPVPSGPPRRVGEPDPPTPPPIFGEEVEGERPLDELILQYLIENARKRRGS